MSEKITAALNGAAIAEALANHYSKMGDNDMASICAAEMQHNLNDAEEWADQEVVEHDSCDFDIDVVLC